MGSSPRLRIPYELISCPRICVNRPLYYEFDYWLGYDPESHCLANNLPDETLRFKGITSDADRSEDKRVFNFMGVHDVQHVWDERLYLKSTSSTAAINLALVMGASEVILTGIDYLDQKRIDMEDYEWTDEDFGHIKRATSEGIQELMKHIKITCVHENALGVPVIDT